MGREDCSITLDHVPAQDEWTLWPHSVHIAVWHWIWGSHDHGKTQPWDEEMACSRGEAWVGQWQLWLAIPQASHQKQARSLIASTPPHITTWYTPRVHTSPIFHMMCLHNRIWMVEAGGRLWWRKSTCTGGCIWAEWGKQLQVPALEKTQLCDWNKLRAQTGFPCFNTPARTSHGRVLVWWEGKLHTEGEQSQLRPNPQCFCYSNLRSELISDRAVMATE